MSHFHQFGNLEADFVGEVYYYYRLCSVTMLVHAWFIDRLQ